MFQMILSPEMTNALQDIRREIKGELRTAAHADLDAKTIEVMKLAYREIDPFLKAVSESFNLESDAIRFSPGNWIASGRVFGHIWGGFFPKEAGRISGDTPQLYIIRKVATLSWGICLSNRAQANHAFVAATSEVFKLQESNLKPFKDSGFDFQSMDATGVGNHRTMFSKTVVLADANIENLTAIVTEDLKNLYAVFLELVKLCRANHLFRPAATAEEEPEVPISTMSPQYWVIAPGASASLFKESLAKGVISLGWNEVGDLSVFKNQEALKKKYIDEYSPEKEPVNNSKALFEFAHEIKVGDVIFAKDGRNKMVGMGVITSEYYFDPSGLEHWHLRKIDWKNVGSWDLDGDLMFGVKALTKLQNPEFIRKLLELTRRKVAVNAQEPETEISEGESEPYSVQNAMADLFFTDDVFGEMFSSLKIKKNIILQGPPGVGKTFVAERLAYALIGEKQKSRVGFVQFHPSYSYEDFIQGYRPNANGFHLQKGTFFRFCDLAKSVPQKNFVFIIDEINRGNLSKIFGELLMLIESDKRDKSISLTYSSSGETFALPPNVYLIGTMNTADRSLSLVDYALRRRFRFFDLKPQFASTKFHDHLSLQGLSKHEVEHLQAQMTSLNKIIANDQKSLGPGFEIGHSYFNEKPSDQVYKDWYRHVMEQEIVHLLREYWFDDKDKADRAISGLKAA